MPAGQHPLIGTNPQDQAKQSNEHIFLTREIPNDVRGALNKRTWRALRRLENSEQLLPSVCRKARSSKHLQQYGIETLLLLFARARVPNEKKQQVKGAFSPVEIDEKGWTCALLVGAPSMGRVSKPG